MSDEHEAAPSSESSADDSVKMRALLKRSLGVPEAEKEPAPNLLRGVQTKIRRRSKGKFYGDGWSTAQSRINYVLVAVLMLVLVAVVWFALGPTGFAAR
jgi:hypothetical protein